MCLSHRAKRSESERVPAARLAEASETAAATRFSGFSASRFPPAARTFFSTLPDFLAKRSARSCTLLGQRLSKACLPPRFCIALSCPPACRGCGDRLSGLAVATLGGALQPLWGGEDRGEAGRLPIERQRWRLRLGTRQPGNKGALPRPLLFQFSSPGTRPSRCCCCCPEPTQQIAPFRGTLAPRSTDDWRGSSGSILLPPLGANRASCVARVSQSAPEPDSKTRAQPGNMQGLLCA